MKIQVLKNETYQSTDNLPKKGTDRATGFDVVVTSDPEIVGTQYENGAYKRIDYIQYKTNLKLAVQKSKFQLPNDQFCRRKALNKQAQVLHNQQYRRK